MLDMAQPRRRLPQSDQLHLGHMTLPVSMNIAKTRSFPEADIGSDHKLVMMTFRLHLQMVKKQGSIRIRFSLEKLKDPNIAGIFQAMIGGKFALILALGNQDTEIDTLINSFVYVCVCVCVCVCV